VGQRRQRVRLAAAFGGHWGADGDGDLSPGPGGGWVESRLAGRYAVEIGLYDPATGGRLPVLDDQGQTVAHHLVLTHLTVESD